MTTIKPIETQYKGYRFRSRLEARWAVFFDAVKEPYEYEPEGFAIELGNEKIFYLPDFKIPKHDDVFDDLWIEIKPLGDLTEDTIKKAVAFSYGTHNNLIVLCGDPWFETIGYEFGCKDGVYYAAQPRRITQCPATFADKTHSPHIAWIAPNPEDCRPKEIPAWQWNNIYKRLTRSDWLMKAYYAARSARFEHGETPRL